MVERATSDAMTHVAQEAASVHGSSARGKMFAGSVIASLLVVPAGRGHDARVPGCVTTGLGALVVGVPGRVKGDAHDAMTLIAAFFPFCPIHAGHIRAKRHCVTKRHFRS